MTYPNISYILFVLQNLQLLYLHNTTAEPFLHTKNRAAVWANSLLCSFLATSHFFSPYLSETPCDRPAELKRLIKRNRHHLNTSGALA